eukprot:TRINITY_DN3242_c0_g1_i2.p1 TRINITY_DN3242_c0_g1~~TRINITY_DN3242_c0_g1_i2.p1  ORF type:complete len:100 (+),score=18.40 TRINITY_DN3242_c0_g1_i2:90-389(+)
MMLRSAVRMCSMTMANTQRFSILSNSAKISSLFSMSSPSSSAPPPCFTFNTTSFTTTTDSKGLSNQASTTNSSSGIIRPCGFSFGESILFLSDEEDDGH